MVKRKLTKITDWLLLSPAGEILMIFLLIGFCLAVAGGALLLGMNFDDYSKPQYKTKMEEKVGFELIRL